MLTRTTVSVLGKRKPSASSYAIQLQSTPESAQEQATVAKVKPIIINGRLADGNTKKRYQCTSAGCEKAYTKPSRLAEHMRSHTGERPFVCNVCEKSYFRESHLQAHARSHFPASDKAFACTLQDCQKRFWTQQHLRRHADWHEGLMPFLCTELDCDKNFAKHHQLRAHIASVHAPPDTKPYRCLHAGCLKSFETNQKLRIHARIHNEKRYTCAHADCLPASDPPIIFFPTWSALQNHTRTVHPPMCTHSSCNGRIFSNAGNLRAHLKLHAQRDEEGQLNAALAPSKEGGKEDQPPKKRRRGGEYGRDWKCSVENCEKDFKSNKALTVHHNVTHLGKRDHICAHVDCGAFFGYKHLLQRHITRAHSKPAEESAHDVDSGASSFSGSGFPESGHFESNTLAAAPVMSLDIATITGVAYSARAEKLLKETKVFCCPFPHLGDHKIKFIVVSAEDDTEIILDETTTTEPTSDVAGLIGPNCQYVFSRGYDLRRHLRAVHKLDTAKESVDRWVKKLKDSTQRN